MRPDNGLDPEIRRMWAIVLDALEFHKTVAILTQHNRTLPRKPKTVFFGRSWLKC